MNLFLKTVSWICYDNDFDTNDRAWVPEVWAQETLAILEENMVIGNLVHTDFEDEIANFGDTVNTRKPGTFSAKRKGVNDDVTVQNATAENIPVVLDQHIHTSFLIRDGQESLSFRDLVTEYLHPAALSLAQAIDKILLGQSYQFLSNGIGDLGRFSSTSAKGEILNVRQKMNENKAPVVGRNMILAPGSETETLKLDLFISADKIGDEGTAMREASLGRKLGFDFFMSQNVSSIGPVGSGDYTYHADELASDGVVGATTVTLDSGVADDGQYITLENDEQPLRIISGGGTTTPVFNRPLRLAVPTATSNLIEYIAGDVALTEHVGVTSYPIGYAKQIRVDGTGDPHVGQLVSFSASTTMRTGEYSIIDVEVIVANTSWYITLDRPLEAALADNDKANYGPIGDYNFAFTRNALALVTRPLAPPKTGTGALSGVASFNDLSIRVTITYNGTQQGHLVTLDLLAGVKVLDTDQGAIMFGGSQVLIA